MYIYRYICVYKDIYIYIYIYVGRGIRSTVVEGKKRGGGSIPQNRSTLRKGTDIRSFLLVHLRKYMSVCIIDICICIINIQIYI
jgi:hypothetical protein